MRVVTLAPAATDVVAALGLGGALVGVSHECDHAAARGVEVVTRSRIGASPAVAAAEVDRQVEAALAAGEALYVTDGARLAALGPDVVVGQTICDVCAVGAGEAARTLPAGARLVVMGGTTVAGLAEDVRRVAAALGVEAAGERVMAEAEGRLAAVRAAVAGAEKVRALVVEWSDPVFLGGHQAPELVEVAGGRHLLAGAGEVSRRATWEEVRAADPEVVIFAPCGYRLEEAVAEGEALVEPGGPLAGTRAAREGRVWAIDATRWLSRLTPASLGAAEVMATLLHPERCGPVDAGSAQRLGGPAAR